MTNNQINYARLREDVRSHKASERTERHKAVSSRIQAITGLKGLKETATHNRAMESISKDQLAESIRHNSANETIDMWKLGETSRANKARENETERTNRANEAIKDYSARENIRLGELNAQSQQLQAQASYRQSSAALSQAGTAQGRLNEDIRHNLSNELLQERSVANQYNIDLGKNIEANRHNRVTETEAGRHNAATEQQTKSRDTNTYVTETNKVATLRRRNEIESLRTYADLAKSIVTVLGGLKHGR